MKHFNTIPIFNESIIGNIEVGNSQIPYIMSSKAVL